MRASRAPEVDLESYGALLQRLTREEPSPGSEASGVLQRIDPVERYAYHRLALEANAGGRLGADLDFEIARRMRQESLPVEQIAAALEAGSPDLAVRMGDARMLALETALRADEAVRATTKAHLRGPNPEIER